MTTAAVLDPAAARPLTSREIAKVLNGIIVCVVTYDAAARSSIQGVIDQVRVNPMDFERIDRLALEEGRPHSFTPSWATALSATVVGMQGWCEAREVSTALMWISQNLDHILPPFDGVRPSH